MGTLPSPEACMIARMLVLMCIKHIMRIIYIYIEFIDFVVAWRHATHPAHLL